MPLTQHTIAFGHGWRGTDVGQGSRDRSTFTASMASAEVRWVSLLHEVKAGKRF
jgi:hypothetical protein